MAGPLVQAGRLDSELMRKLVLVVRVVQFSL